MLLALVLLYSPRFHSSKHCAGADRRESAREHKGPAADTTLRQTKARTSDLSLLGHGLKLSTRCVDFSVHARILFSFDEGLSNVLARTGW